MKTLVFCKPHFLGFSNARSLFAKLPEGRMAASEPGAHVMLYDDAEQAIREFSGQGRPMLHIVVKGPSPAPKLPKGMFWIEDDIAQLLSLIRILHPGGE